MPPAKLAPVEARSLELTPNLPERVLYPGWIGRGGLVLSGLFLFWLGLTPLIRGVEWLVLGGGPWLANVFCGLLHVALGLLLLVQGARGIRSLLRPSLVVVPILLGLFLADVAVMLAFGHPDVALLVLGIGVLGAVDAQVRRRAFEVGEEEALFLEDGPSPG